MMSCNGVGVMRGCFSVGRCCWLFLCHISYFTSSGLNCKLAIPTGRKVKTQTLGILCLSSAKYMASVQTHLSIIQENITRGVKEELQG